METRKMVNREPEYYQYKSKLYVLLDEIQAKNPVGREWYVAALYADDSGNRYARDLSEFCERFSLFQFPQERERLNAIFHAYWGK